MAYPSLRLHEYCRKAPCAHTQLAPPPTDAARALPSGVRHGFSNIHIHTYIYSRPPRRTCASPSPSRKSSALTASRPPLSNSDAQIHILHTTHTLQQTNNIRAQANVCFAQSINEKFGADGITAASLHPGSAVATDIARQWRFGS